MQKLDWLNKMISILSMLSNFLIVGQEAGLQDLTFKKV